MTENLVLGLIINKIANTGKIEHVLLSWHHATQSLLTQYCNEFGPDIEVTSFLQDGPKYFPTPIRKVEKVLSYHSLHHGAKS